MYTKFIQTAENGYVLKKQGTIWIVVVSGAMLALAAFLLMLYLKKPSEQNMLYYAIVMLALALFSLRKATRKFIVYPGKKNMDYSPGLLSAMQSYRFDEFDGVLIEKAQSPLGFTIGNSLKLRFRAKEGEKKIVLGQNLSANNMRTITEEIEQLMGMN